MPVFHFGAEHLLFIFQRGKKHQKFVRFIFTASRKVKKYSNKEKKTERVKR